MSLDTNSLPPERWVPVRGWSEYEVSDRGRVRRNGRFLVPFTGSDGYLRLNLRSRGRSKAKALHAIVLESFCGPRPPDQVARHVNDPDRRNCNYWNLAWGTRLQNAQDARRHGSYQTKLKPDQVREIRRLAEEGKTNAALAAQFGVSTTTIHTIKTWKSWSWLE